jgi:hypothetical protein
VLILEAPLGGVDTLADLVQVRLPLVSRYRQRVAEVSGHPADPVWVDDPEFDIACHVQRSGLPRPGTEAQLLGLVSRLMPCPLDRRRPLWEAYLVEGPPEGRSRWSPRPISRCSTASAPWTSARCCSTWRWTPPLLRPRSGSRPGRRRVPSCSGRGGLARAGRPSDVLRQGPGYGPPPTDEGSQARARVPARHDDGAADVGR